MCPGIEGLEGSNHGHDVIPVDTAIKYLTGRGYPPTVGAILKNIKPASISYIHLGSTKERGANRVQFGEAVSNVLDKIGKEEAAKKVMVIDSTLCNDWFDAYIQRSQVILRGLRVSRSFTKGIPRYSYPPESWSAETCRLQQDLALTRTSLVRLI